MKQILKEAVILLIGVAMVFSTVAVTAETEEQMNPAFIKTTNPNPSEPIARIALGPVMFSQLPTSPTGDWTFYNSAYNWDSICADDFWGLTESICDIHWWGMSLTWTGSGWEECDPTGMCFEIIFYDTNFNPVCEYTQICPTAIETGQYYNGLQMYKWETDLDPCCFLSAGWVSIQSIFTPNDCAFLWANSPDGNWNAKQYWEDINDNLAFQLTGPTPCDPGIDVEKEVWDEKNGEWVDADTQSSAIDAPICSNILFRIKVTNTGDCPLAVGIDDEMHDSLKYISADPKPDEVSYDPPFYYILWVWPTYVMPGETIIITLTAHVEGPECSYDYNYVYVLGETDSGETVEDEDYAYVHAYKKTKEFNTPILNFLQNHPNMFPLLQKLIQQLGFGL
jgi:hypothetical protein